MWVVIWIATFFGPKSCCHHETQVHHSNSFCLMSYWSGPGKLKQAQEIADEDSLEGSSTSFKHEIALSTLNQSLQTIGESPIIKKKLGQSKYPKEKSEKIGVALKRKILCVESDSDVPVNTESEILTQLKDKFNATSTSKSEQVQIMTILPLSWSIKKIEAQFGCSDYMVRKAKKLVKEKGILSTPNPKPGKVLSQKTAD